MPLCGFNPKMLAGLTLFAQGLYEQADKRAKEDNCSLEKSYNSEINEMTILLEKMDEEYYNHFRPLYGAEEGIKKWAEHFLPQQKNNT